MSYGFPRGIQQYQQVNANSAAYADPHRQVQMLMEGALDRLAGAKGAIQRDEVTLKGDLLSKAIAIIAGLQASLDRGAGGEIASNLADLYDYMQRRLLQANLKSDIEAIDEVAELLRDIKQAWDAIPPEARAMSSDLA